MTPDTSWQAVAAAVGMALALCSLAVLGWFGEPDAADGEDES